MSWCPNCHSEYDSDVKVCADCQCKLVDKIISENQLQPVREVFLLTVSDEMEYTIVESKLGEYGIPVTKRYRGSGAVTQIYMGRTFGLDVYVPETALSRAKEILADAINPDQVDEIGEPDETQEISDSKSGTWGKRILLIFVVMTLIALGFLTVMYLIMFLHLN